MAVFADPAEDAPEPTPMTSTDAGSLAHVPYTEPPRRITARGIQRTIAASGVEQTIPATDRALERRRY